MRLLRMALTSGYLFPLVFCSSFCASPCFAEDAGSAPLKIENRVRQRGLLAATYFPAGAKPEIVLVDFGTQEVRKIAPHAALDEYPALSPDGERLAFYSDRTGDREIFVAEVNGTGLRQLTTAPGDDEDPAWSPDGKLIAFHSARLGRGANVFVMNADGSEPKSFTSRESKNTVPKFRPDGMALLFSTDGSWPGWDLEEVDLVSGQTRALTSGIRTSCRGSYSPDGKEILYSFGSGKDIDLWTMEGKKDRQVTDRAGKEYDGVFTTDGGGIFFVGERQRGMGDFQIFYLDRRSGVISQVTDAPGSFRYLSWSAGKAE